MSDQHGMRVKIGTAIIGANGERIGAVDGVVVNPVDDRVRQIVMRKGLIFHSDQSFGVQSITSVDDDGIHVSFTRDEANMMDHWMDADYLTPPAGYFPGNQVFWVTPQTREMGRMNAEEPDLELEDASLGNEQRLVELVNGNEVVDRDGESLGTITDLATDEHGHICAFRVEQGRIRHHDRWIPIHLAAASAEGRIQLSSTVDDLDALLAKQGTLDPGEGFLLDKE